MKYNEFIRRRTVEMLNEKADRLREEIVWLRRRASEYGEDHEYEINKKRSTLSALKRRILILDDYYTSNR